MLNYTEPTLILMWLTESFQQIMALRESTLSYLDWKTQL